MAKADITGRLNLDSTGFQRGIQRSKQSVKGFAKSSMATFVRMGAAFAGIGLVKSIVGLGTAAAETASKFNAVFGSAADAMNEKVQELRKTIPSTTEEMQGALATFAQMAKAFGLNSEAANLFSVEMVKIAGDIASFNNLPIEEAFTKIRSAISGEFEPMKSLGIVINEARLKQEALNLAIWDGTGQMSAAQKALAVQSILIRDMGDANGDAALTADSAANRIKFLQKSLKETGTEIGTTALPAILALTDGLSQMLALTKKATDFMGTSVGEMMFGITDETLAKRKKAITQFQAEQQALKELTAEGKLYKQGMFEGTLWTKGLSEKLENNKRIIEERTRAILDSANATENAKNEETKANNDALRGAKDLSAELESQIETETDPARKKALEDRLESYQNLIKAAGKLKSLQGAKPGTDGTGGTERMPKVKYDPSDVNQSGYVTPREQRAQERRQKKEDQERRARERAERTAEVGADERERQRQRAERMSEREKGSGLSGTTAGRKPDGMSADEKKSSENTNDTASELKEQTKLLTTIKEEIQKNP